MLRKAGTGRLMTGALVLAAATGTGLGAQEDLSDAEVAHVAVTANAIDVEMAGLVEGRTENGEVRQFAETMIRDHRAVNERAAALAGRLGVTPADNAVSRSLRTGAAAAAASLKALQGAAFDGAYMDREVRYHQAVLDALDELLIPTTSNAELRALLEEVRPAIAAHLEHAKAIRAALEKSRARTHAVEIRSFAYHPTRLEVERGDRVVWVNRDVVVHTATAETGAWDSGALEASGSWGLTADAAGSHGYTCALHPTMRATVVVR